MAREVKVGGRTVYLPDREEWEVCRDEWEVCDSPATPERVAEDIDRAWPGLVRSDLRCSGCGTQADGQRTMGTSTIAHWVMVPGGWRKCGEWR